MFQQFTSLIFGLLWVFVHFVYDIITFTMVEVRWKLKYMFNRLLTCFPAYSEHRQLTNMVYNVKLLKEEKRKIPKHLGVVVFGREPLRPIEALWNNLKGILFSRTKTRRGQEEEDDQINSSSHSYKSDHVDLQALAKVVCYAWIADIPVVSLYDHGGYIKSNYKEFQHYVNIELSHNLWIVRERTKVLPTIKLHNVPTVTEVISKKSTRNGYTNGCPPTQNGVGSNGISSHFQDQGVEVLNICLFNYKDGKEAIVTTCKELYKDILAQEDSVSKRNIINEKLVDRKINSVVGLQFYTSTDDHDDKEEIIKKNDPDLMIVLGKVVSTTGFLPWQIRLTEMHWLPPLNRFDENDFLQSILKFANCHQRFGT